MRELIEIVIKVFAAYLVFSTLGNYIPLALVPDAFSGQHSPHTWFFAAHAVEAFEKSELIKAHRLANPVSETLYLCVPRHRALQARMKTVIAEAKRGL